MKYKPRKTKQYPEGKPSDYLEIALRERLDIDTLGGILCVNCFESCWHRGEYKGYEAQRLLEPTDACYNCHADSR